MHHSTDRIAHTTAFVTPVVERWLEGEIAHLHKQTQHPSSVTRHTDSQSHTLLGAKGSYCTSIQGNILFNDAHNTFYLRLYGVRHMVKDHSDSERGNLLLPHRLLFPISSKGSLCIITQDRITHTTAFVTPAPPYKLLIFYIIVQNRGDGTWSSNFGIIYFLPCWKAN